ncbi:hypothetical protein [Arcobacter vandammei]|uniref:hypothetical protein n=1 Tax=Arcobacter vandammei TaxID=2782243 RepID=UPI0018E03507|nr:hypothetical protein [Arcobacter vandammei]
MKKHKRYIFASIFFSLLIFILGIGVKYIIDPVGLNNKFDTGLYKDVALAYRTQKFVEVNNFKPNTLIIGGSRVHYLDNNDLEKYTNDKVYNLGFSFSTLEEQYYYLKYSLEHFPIKNVVLGLNLYPFSQKLEDNSSDFDKDLLEDGFTIFKQIKHYVEVPLFKYLKYVLNNKNIEATYKDGGITAYHQSVVIKNNPKEPMWEGTLKGYKEKYENFLEWGEDSLTYYKMIVELCEKYNVNLKVFTTAVHSDMLKLLEETDKVDIFQLWKRELSTIYPYWDFMYENSITNDKDAYIDPSHLKQEYGKYYFARLFNDKNVDVPNDFGVYIKKK